MNSVIHLGVEDMTATVVKVLLFLGALFQMVCLGACIFVKETANDSNWAPRLKAYKNFQVYKHAESGTVQEISYTR
ncbi:hypothetical protein YQE_00576, partial [Dendroctonus ponderosae]